jgi:hypothetical protein
MTWTKLGDDFNDDERLLECSRSARLLYVELYVYANRNELDGRIPLKRLPRFSDSDDLEAELEELRQSGAITGDEQDEQVVVLDWTDQEDSSVLEQRRARRAQTQKDYRARQEAHRSGEHHESCRPENCPTVHATGNGAGHVTGNKTAPRPVPSRPAPQGQERNATAGTADAEPPPLGRPDAHAFIDDGTGLSCDECNLPAHHPLHQEDGRAA